jgi:outer membrane receptor protein involved in Fe transport
MKIRVQLRSTTILATALLAGSAMPGWAAQSPANPAAATGQSAAAAEVEEIVVSGSRITVSGYEAPTPVTVVGEEQLTRDAKPSIGDVIRQIPAVTGGASPFTQGSGVIAAGTAGLDTLDLRNLGTSRTLVLFDGQRVTQSVVTGQVDLSTIPNMLVQRIDVVTGGASSAYGSDALAGVVNLILNKRFTGVKVSADYGNTDKWDDKNYRFQVAAGTDFANGRGHVIVAGNYVNNPQVVFAGERDWNRYRQLLPNPAYTATNDQPKYIHVDNVGLSQATNGGLIVGHINPTTGASVTTGSPFRGIQFVGPGATPQPFTFGIVQGPVCGNCSAEIENAQFDNLTVDFKSATLFGLATYDVTDKIKASVQINYGRAISTNNSVPNTAFGSLRIQSDNAYLPASIRSQMQASGINTLLVGSTYLNNIPSNPKDWSWDTLEQGIGMPIGHLTRRLLRGVFSLDGDIDDGWYGQKWNWKAYYQGGRTHMYQTSWNNNITANLTSAIDAVVAPAGNTAGVPAGTIVCRSTLTNPTNGCVPLDIFGVNTASPAAIRYVNVKPGDNFQDQHFNQDVFSLSLSGELPFALPAGNPAVAFGGEHRRERGVTVVDPADAVGARKFALGNFAPFYGKYHVTEGFVEVDAPLLKDNVVQSLALNGAVRVTDYSTSGTVTTWKVGLTSQLEDNVRLRGTISRDIRAPNLSELFAGGAASTNSAVDPHTGQNVPIYTVAGGNPNLTPEIGKTKSFGAVVTPTFLPHFSASADFYDIKITNAIVTVGANNILQRCNAGEAVYCSALVFAGPVGPAGPALSQINTAPLNASQESSRGIDFQADYNHPLLDGTMSYRLRGNYILQQTRTLFGNTQRCDGSNGVDGGLCTGVPKLRGTLAATYDQGPASFTVQTRYIGSSKLGFYWTSKDVDKNTVPALAYLDLRASYNVQENFQVFANMDNVMDLPPPNIPASAGNTGSAIYYFTAVRAGVWDVIGRTFRVGVRAQF